MISTIELSKQSAEFVWPLSSSSVGGEYESLGWNHGGISIQGFNTADFVIRSMCILTLFSLETEINFVILT